MLSSLKSGDRSYLFFLSLIMLVSSLLFLHDTRSALPYQSTTDSGSMQAVLSKFSLYEIDFKETRMLLNIDEATKYADMEEIKGIRAQRASKDGVDRLDAASAKRMDGELEFPFGLRYAGSDGTRINSGSALYDFKKEQLKSSGTFDLGFGESRAAGSNLVYDYAGKKVYADDVKLVFKERTWKK